MEGLIHINEITTEKGIQNPNQILEIGQEVSRVLDIDDQDRKISLSMKQLETDPWEQAAIKYPKGTRVSGKKVVNIKQYGAFVELDQTVNGMIHISDISWTKNR